jgi:hypothetical protein
MRPSGWAALLTAAQQLLISRLRDILARIARLAVAPSAHQLIEFRIAVLRQHDLDGDQTVARALLGGNAFAAIGWCAQALSISTAIKRRHAPLPPSSASYSGTASNRSEFLRLELHARSARIAPSARADSA